MYNYCLWPKWPEGQRNDANPIIKYKLHMHIQENCMLWSELMTWAAYIIPWNTIFLSLSFLVTYPPSGPHYVETTDRDSSVPGTLSRVLFSSWCMFCCCIRPEWIMDSHCVPWQSEYHLNNDQEMPLLAVDQMFLQKKQSLKWEYVEHILCFIDAIT